MKKRTLLKNTRLRKKTGDDSLVVISGREWLGVIRRRNRWFEARDRNGRLVGRFGSGQAAFRAVLDGEADPLPNARQRPTSARQSASGAP